MPGFYTEPFRLNERLFRTEHDLTEATLGETLGATLDQTFAENPLQSLRNLGATDERPDVREQIFRGRGVDPESFGGRPLDDQVPRLSPEEANQRYGIPGALTFDAPVSEDIARIKRDAARERLQRQDVLRRASSDVGTIGAQFLTGLVASALDPLNVAAAFVPVVGPARYAIWAQRFGATRARLATGAIEGAVGTAALEPLILAGQSAVGNEDYSAVDSLLNITFGTILGGGLHVGLGRLGDALGARGLADDIAEAPQDLREAAIRAAVAQFAEDRPVNVDPILRSSPEAFSRAPDAPFEVREAGELARELRRTQSARSGVAAADLLPEGLPGVPLEDLALVRSANWRTIDIARSIEEHRPDLAAALRDGRVTAVSPSEFDRMVKRYEKHRDIRPRAERVAKRPVEAMRPRRPSDGRVSLEPAGLSSTAPPSRESVAAVLRVQAALDTPTGRQALEATAAARAEGLERRIAELRQRVSAGARRRVADDLEAEMRAGEDTAADPEIARKVEHELRGRPVDFAAELDQEIEFLQEGLAIPEADAADLARLDAWAEAVGRGARQAAACLTRNA